MKHKEPLRKFFQVFEWRAVRFGSIQRRSSCRRMKCSEHSSANDPGNELVEICYRVKVLLTLPEVTPQHSLREIEHERIGSWHLFEDESVSEWSIGFSRVKCDAHLSTNEAQAIRAISRVSMASLFRACRIFPRVFEKKILNKKF